VTSLRTQLDWFTKVQWLLGLCLVLLAAAFFVFGYRPCTVRQSELHQQLDSKRRDLLNNTARVRILPDVERAVTELEVRVDNYDKQLPRQQDLGQFIRDIHGVVRDADLRRVTVQPGVPHRSELAGNTVVSELPIALRFEGDFLSVFNFLRKTEEMQRLTRVRDLKLKNADRQGSKPGQVEVELSMNIYFSEG
jgi:Tfp pilus assembly protein PilO